MSCSHVWEIGMTPKEIFVLFSLFWSCKFLVRKYFLFSATPSPVLSRECSSMWEMSCQSKVWDVKQRCWTRRFPFTWCLTCAWPVLHVPWTCLDSAFGLLLRWALQAFGGQIQQFLFRCQHSYVSFILISMLLPFPSNNQVMILQDIFSIPSLVEAPPVWMRGNGCSGQCWSPHS